MNPQRPLDHLVQTSDGQLYLRRHVKTILIRDKKDQVQTIPRYQTLRCLPDGSILPRIRMSKKTRLKLKHHLANAP